MTSVTICKKLSTIDFVCYSIGLNALIISKGEFYYASYIKKRCTKPW